MNNMIVPYSIVSLLVIVYGLSGVSSSNEMIHQSRSTTDHHSHLRMLQQNSNNSHPTIPSASAGSVDDDEENDNDTMNGPYYVLKHDPSNPNSIFALVSHAIDGKQKIVPCTMEEPDKKGNTLIECDKDNIHLDLHVHIVPATGIILYTDAFNEIQKVYSSNAIDAFQPTLPSNVTSTLSSKDPDAYYVLKHNSKNTSTIFALVSNNDNFIKTNTYDEKQVTIVPCKLTVPEQYWIRPYIVCIQRKDNIHLNLTVHIDQGTGTIHYTDPYNRLQIIESSNIVPITSSSSSSKGILFDVTEVDYHNKWVITSLVIVGLITVVFFTYCTCCCWVNDDDDDDDDDDEDLDEIQKQKKRNHKLMIMKAKKAGKKQAPSSNSDHDTVSDSENNDRTKYSTDANNTSSSSLGTSILLNRSLVDIDLSESSKVGKGFEPESQIVL